MPLIAKNSLLREPNFQPYILGQTIALFTAAMTPIIMPLIAVLTLDATAFETAVVSAVSLAPRVLLMLQIGALLDQRPKRQAMLRANLGVAVSLSTLPILYWFDALSIPALCVIGFVSSACEIVAQVADQSLLPYLIQEEQLVEGNSKVALSESTASMAGPTAAGVLVTAITGPATIGIAALGGLFSAFTLSRVTADEPPIENVNERPRLRTQITEGLGFIWHQPILRTLMLVNGVDNGFVAWIQAIVTVYFIRELKWSAATIGIVLGVAAVGGIIGSLCVGWFHDKLGTSRLLLVAIVLGGPFEAVVLLLRPGLLGMVIAVIGQFIVIFFSVCYSVTSRTLRMQASPNHMRSRITAAHRWVSVAVTPIGALLGGVVATQVGVRGSIAIACLGLVVAPLIAIASPLRHSDKVEPLADPA